MSSSLNRLIGDETHENLIGGYWIFIRRVLWVGVPLLMIFGGIALGIHKIWVAIIVGGSLGPLIALENKFVAWAHKATGESSKASTASGKAEKV
ncbi:MAG: hypothetical protein HOA04_01150 [Euryarchaeota archaeon]|jgi:hypothetical protein|nr:hypothetical protein [Euryarchaeota archaeon]MBT7938668.1 hypothetical protein [Euryarchaeota archaeon]